MGTVFGNKGAIRAACLMVGVMCCVSVPRVQAAEEGGILQPSSAKIYSSMSDGSDVIANLIVGNVFEVVDAQNDSGGGIWYRIRTDFGAEGYVKAGELDQLVAEAQALLPSSAVTVESNVTADSAIAAEDNAMAEDNAGEETSGEGDSVSEDNNSEEPVPGDDPGSEGAAPADNNGNHSDGGDSAPEDNNGEVSVSGDNLNGGTAGESATLEPENSYSGGKLPSDGADKEDSTLVMDVLAGKNAITGNGEFTFVEDTEKPKTHRRGRIDAMLITIAAGGILCVTAIAVLLRKIRICAGKRI